MTAQQLDSVKSLAERFGSSLKNTSVTHNAFGLPDAWVQVVVFKVGTKPGCETSEDVIIVAGVSPEGNVHT